MRGRRPQLLAVIGVLAIAGLARAADKAVGPRLQEACVTIRKGSRDLGSGLIVVREVEGEPHNFIVTAEHVANLLRHVEDVISADGSERKRVAYYDAELLKEKRHEGRTVGRIIMDAKVLNVDKAFDLALLQVRAPNVYTQGVEFYLGDEIPAVGTEVYHVGSPGGADIGASSLTSGVISRIGVRMEQFGGSGGIYDQTDCAGLGGSSGGMVALRDTGEVVGVVTIGLRSADSFNWFVGVRRIREWVEKTDIEWVLEKDGKTTRAALDTIPLENAAPGFKRRDGGGDEKHVRLAEPVGLRVIQRIGGE